MKTLCKGYTKQFAKNDEWMEILYAVLNDGTILETNPKKVSSLFASKSWKKSSLSLDDLKTSAEFIGNYEAPGI